MQTQPRSDALPVLALIACTAIIGWAILHTQPEIATPVAMQPQAAETYVPAVEQAQTVMADQDSQALQTIAAAVQPTMTATRFPTSSPKPTWAVAHCVSETVKPGTPCVPYLTPYAKPLAALATATIPACAHPAVEQTYSIIKGIVVCSKTVWPTPVYPTGEAE